MLLWESIRRALVVGGVNGLDRAPSSFEWQISLGEK